MPAPPRRSRPWSQGNLAGGASADCRSALYGLLRTGRGRGSWATAQFLAFGIFITTGGRLKTQSSALRELTRRVSREIQK